MPPIQVIKWEKQKQHENVLRSATGFGELKVNKMKECSIYTSWQILVPLCLVLEAWYLNKNNSVGSFPSKRTPRGSCEIKQ